MYQESVMLPVGNWSNGRLKNLSEIDKIRDNSKNGSGFGKNISNWVGRKKVYPTNVLHLATECNNKNHSATFPKTLPEWFIKLFTQEGDTVLDPFMGSGTTNIVAKTMNRNSIGIEIIKEYYEMVEKNIKPIEPKMSLTRNSIAMLLILLIFCFLLTSCQTTKSIHGVTLYNYTKSYIKSSTFHSGKPTSTIRKDGLVFQKGKWLHLFENGNVHGGVLAFNQVIKGISYTGAIYFYKNGKVMEGYLATDRNINDIVLSKHSRVYFHGDGSFSGWENPDEWIYKKNK